MRIPNNGLCRLSALAEGWQILYPNCYAVLDMPEVGGGIWLNIRMQWVAADEAYVVLCSEHGVASATYAGSERLTALSEARAHLMAEHTPGKVTDEWLKWADVEIEAARKLGWE